MKMVPQKRLGLSTGRGAWPSLKIGEEVGWEGLWREWEGSVRRGESGNLDCIFNNNNNNKNNNNKENSSPKMLVL